MTVFQRSGDVIWGCLGANAVHMSFLMEYIASRLGLVVGTMTTVVDDFHAYRNVYDKLLVDMRTTAYEQISPYDTRLVVPYPIVRNADTWDMDLEAFLADPSADDYDNPFFSAVARPLWFAHTAFRDKRIVAAVECLDWCQALDWRLAAIEWLQRRRK
jgi:hypothetical protein